MIKLARLTCLWSTILAVFSLHHTGSLQAADGGIKVEIMMYSGRPNPTFVLKEKKQLDQARMLMMKSKSMRSMEKAVVPPALGYRGIMVENEGKIKELPERFVVYQGNIEVLGKEKAYFSDSGRAFEKFLLEEAGKQKVIDENMSQKLGMEK